MLATSGSGLLMAEGKPRSIREGYVFFIEQGVELVLEAEAGLQVYSAYAE